ncbi:MAG: PQQ-binding-like beta-propeller repeat protein, partial [Phycisphaeraceae bacterium]
MMRVFVCLALMMGFVAATLSPAVADRPAMERARLDDPAMEISWRDTWGETYELNRQRFDEQVSDATDDARTAQTRLERRLVYLVERMIDRFDPVGDERLAAYETLVEHLHRGALHHPELDYLKRIATEFPGRVDAATEALSTLLSRAGAMADTVEGARHHRDAAERLLALGRAGHLPPGDPLMARAHRALGEAYRDEGRYFEAAAAFAAALAAGEDALDVALAEAAMLADLGRLTDAAARYDALLQGHPTESDAGRAITARLQRVEARRERYTFAPSFPQEAGLGGRWDALRRRGDDAGLADEIQRLLERDVAGQNVVSQRERVRQSIWRSIEALVLERPGLREALAAAQQERAERALADAAGDEAATLAAARRYPWANATQAALLELGERALWDGRLGAVERHLDDVLRRAGDAAQRETAERGLAMVRRHAQLPHAGPEPSLGSLAYLGVPVDAPLWPTGFLNRVPAAALDPLVPLPLAIVTSDDAAHTAVAGPGGLAVYGPGDTTPRWARVAGWTSGMSRGSSIRREITIPAPMRPAIDGGRVYTLWGLDTSRRHPAGLAAFDIRTGEMIWSTDGDDALVDAQLVGDPAVADGFVYCLAVRQGLITPIELVALDAATGELRWRRRLATQTPELAGPDSGPLSDREIDLVRYGSGVRVAGGYVYANTNMGLVARLDARDGVIDWIHQYPRLHLDDQWRQTVRRRGGAPVVVRDTLVVTPRDSSGAIALDGQTGAIVWDAPLIPGEQMLGVVRDAVLLAEGHVLVSVAVTSGEVRWRRSFDAPIRAEPVLAGDELLVAAGDRLHRFDARTGGRIEEAPLDREPTALRALGVRGGQVVAISDEPAAAPAEADAPTAEPAVVPPGRWFDADEDRRLESLPTFPLTRLGLLARAEAELLVPDAEAAMGDDLVLHSPGLIERIDPRDPTAPRWQRTVTRTVREVAWAPGLILLIGDDSIHSLDAATGRTAWRYDPAMPINRWRAFDDQFVLLNESGTSGPPRLAAIDRATGRELWTRDLSRDFGSFRVRELLADEGTLHLLGYFVRGRKAALKFDLADGAYTGEGPYLGDPDDVARPSRTIKVVGRVFYYTGEDRRLYRWELGSIDGPERFEPTLSGAFRYGAAMRVHVDGPWIQVRQYNRDGTPDYEHWTFHRDDPDTMIHRDRPGLIHEARIYEMHGSHVGAYNLRTGERVATYRLPPVEHAWAPRGLGNWIAGLPGWLHGRYSLRFSPGARAAWIDDGHMLVATGFGGPGWPHPADRLRLDRFDLDTGERVGRQMLPMTHDAFTQLVYRGGHLLVTDRDGLHAFAPATALTTPPLSAAEGGGAAPTAPGSRAWLAHHLSEAPDFRGASPAAWGATPYTLTDAAGRDARLVL